LRDNPQSSQAARDVSLSLNRLGDFLAHRGQQGDAEKALTHFQRSVELCERLLQDDPESGRAARDVSVSVESLGDFLVGRGQQGDAEKALAHYQRTNELRERLLQDNPHSDQAARDLSASLIKLGDFLVGRGHRGDAEKALVHYQRSNELLEGLLRDNPQSVEAARDVSVSLIKLGDFLAHRGQQGDSEKALAHFQRSLELLERLLRDNSQSGRAARDVSVSLDRLGDFLAGRGQQGDAENALAHYQRSNELLERLLRDNPQSGQAARDVSLSLGSAGWLSGRPRPAGRCREGPGSFPA
jgi:tetratricopeptide (TPR) repeat protein